MTNNQTDPTFREKRAQTMSRETNRPPIVFGAERVLLGVQIAEQFVVFDSNDPYVLGGVSMSLAPAGGTSEGLDVALNSGTSYHGGRIVLEAKQECGIGLHQFHSSGDTKDLDAVRSALPHFLESITDPDLRETLDEIGQHLGISGPDGPDEDDLDEAECPYCFADAFRANGTDDDFQCGSCHRRFPYSERNITQITR